MAIEDVRDLVDSLAEAADNCDWDKWEEYELKLVDQVEIELEREIPDYPSFQRAFFFYDVPSSQKYERLRERIMRCGGRPADELPEWE